MLSSVGVTHSSCKHAAANRIEMLSPDITVCVLNRVGGNLGLFATRFFLKGSMIGYYSNSIAWRCPDAGTVEPTSNKLNALLLSVTHKLVSNMQKLLERWLRE
jgi:hypothetical protein